MFLAVANELKLNVHVIINCKVSECTHTFESRRRPVIELDIVNIFIHFVSSFFLRFNFFSHNMEEEEKEEGDDDDEIFLLLFASVFEEDYSKLPQKLNCLSHFNFIFHSQLNRKNYRREKELVEL